jgi:hypothetical protein
MAEVLPWHRAPDGVTGPFGAGWPLSDGCSLQIIRSDYWVFAMVWKFVYELETRRSKLFDLGQDPGETIDVSKDHVDRTAVYEGRLRAWSAAQKGYLAANGALQGE